MVKPIAFLAVMFLSVTSASAFESQLCPADPLDIVHAPAAALGEAPPGAAVLDFAFAGTASGLAPPSAYPWTMASAAKLGRAAATTRFTLAR